MHGFPMTVEEHFKMLGMTDQLAILDENEKSLHWSSNSEEVEPITFDEPEIVKREDGSIQVIVHIPFEMEGL